jgi:conjugative transposon TraM protein
MNKKELTPQQIQQRKKLFIYPVFFIVFVICMYFIFVPFSPKETFEDVNGFNAEIPSAQVDEMPDKISAFEKTQVGEMKTLDDYAFLLTKEKETTEKKVVEDTLLNKQPESQIIASISAYQDVNREMKSFYQPTTARENKEKEDLKREIEKLQQQLQVTPKQTDTQYDMMERSFQLAAKYLNPTQSQQPLPAAVKNNQSRNSNIVFVEPEQENIVTRLGEKSDSAFIKGYAKNRNLGFNTVSTNKYVRRNTIRACINTDQLLLFGESTGAQKVQIRLLENIRVGDINIPRNTIVMGIAKLSSERVDISINSLEYLGNILSVSLIIYDIDGLKGLYCPGSVERNTVKDIAGNTVGNAGTSITFGGNAGQQLITDVSRNVIQGATQYLGKKVRMTKVTLKSGYEVLITNSK